MTISLIRRAAVCAGIVALVLPAVAGAQNVKQVEVTNFPNPQNVVGSVEVTNLPAVQDVFVTNPSAPAPPARFQLVGFTAASYTGAMGGPFGATQKCQLEFLEGSRMCTTLEVLDTVDIPVGLVGDAWVRPLVGGASQEISQDISGFPAIISCDFWTNLDGSGLAITAEGQIVARSCRTLPLSIACCALVP